MKKSWLKWLVIGLLAVIVFVVGIPIIINECYKANSGYITMWSAADVLSYYGAIITSAGAAIGIYVSLRYSHKQYREDKCRDVLPYFAINILGRKCVNPFDLGWYDNEDGVGEKESEAKDALTYSEFSYDECFFVFKSEKIECNRKLSKEQEDARRIGMTGEDRGEFGEIWISDKKYIPMKAINVGNGCAINTTVTIKAIGKDMVATSIPVSIPVGEEFYTGLLFCIAEEIAGEYDYIMRYYDIYGNLYEHHKTITIRCGKNNCSVEIARDTSHVWIEKRT